MMAPETGKKTLVIGLGNPLSEDDAFGLLVLERLKLEPGESLPDADIIAAYDDLLGQVDRFSAYERVIIIDSALDAAECAASHGNCKVLDEEQLLSWPDESPSVHQFSPLLAVRLFRRLYPESKTRFALAAVCLDEVRMKSSLSKETRDRIIEEAAQKVINGVKHHCREQL